MRRFLWLAVILLIWVAQAQAAGFRELVSEAELFDTSRIVYEGEIIGSVLRRGPDFVWLSVYDGDGAISVWVPAEQAGEIRHTGSYKKKGDVVRVEGIFHRSCPQHGGGLDIHADSLEIMSSGGWVPEYLNRKKIGVLSGLLGVLACLLILHILLKRRKT